MIDWNEYFYYDSSSPSGLRWKKSIYSGKHKNILNVMEGDVAGGIRSDSGYWMVSLGNKQYPNHRVIWKILKGDIPLGMQIDHVDGNRQNNLISNLRTVTKAENARNAKQQTNNSSGVSGVTLHSIYNKYQQATQWRARWNTLDGKRKAKSFSIEKYGYNEAFRLACEWRQKMILELNTQGAGYTDRHRT